MGKKSSTTLFSVGDVVEWAQGSSGSCQGKVETVMTEDTDVEGNTGKTRTIKASADEPVYSVVNTKTKNSIYKKGDTLTAA